MAEKKKKLTRHDFSVLRTVGVLAACCAVTLLIFREVLMVGDSAVVFALLVLLYAVATAAILLY